MIRKIFRKLTVTFSEKNREFNKNYNKDYFYEYSSDKLTSQKNVLDLGCGIGEFLKRRGTGTVGIDKNFKSLLKAKRHCETLVESEVLNLPFQDASFDGVNCSHVIEHMLPIEAHQLLQEINRVLKISGLIVFSTPTLWNGFFDDFTHIKPYYPKAIMHYLGPDKEQSTQSHIDCLYTQEEIKWRYKRMRINPIIISKSGLPNTFMYLFAQFLNRIGIRKYEISGYTMVLKKVE